MLDADDRNLDHSNQEDETGENETLEHVFSEEDPGTLSYELRDLLVYLLRGPFLQAADNIRLWNLLCANKEIILSQLANIYLTLFIDEKDGIAFIKNLPIENAPSLLSSFNYKLLDSVLIVELRERLMVSETTGEKAMISKEEIASLLSFYSPFSAHDQIRFNRSVDAVIERSLRRHFLVPLPNKGDFEISRILKVMFSASDVTALSKAYEELIKAKSVKITNKSEEDSDGNDVFA